MCFGLPGTVTRQPSSFGLFLGVRGGYCFEDQPGEAGEGRDGCGNRDWG